MYSFLRKKLRSIKGFTLRNKLTVLKGLGFLVLIAILACYLPVRQYQRDRNYERTLTRARELVDKGSYDKAKSMYLELSSSPKADANIYYELGIVYLHQKQYKEAIEAYKKGSSLDGHNALTYNILANLYRDYKDYPNAEANYLKAIAINPNLSLAVVNLAYLYQTEGKLDSAIDLLTKYLATNNKSHDIEQQLVKFTALKK